MFDLRPPRSSYNALFQGTELGEALKRMPLTKAVPEGLESVESERGIGGKNSPICYILEEDPIQEVDIGQGYNRPKQVIRAMESNPGPRARPHPRGT